ncbi:hypothetical protein AA0119_g13584 [Alternaria tenuissima]|uniref:Uncharacterized protein n=1 Tax=Alternaria tenuissima TaxID=119927 RepID=A0ABY0FQS2_9PLEO|nr:hypothetical protein AA0119_g13584 [Alternaria tenuissima]
MDCALTDAKLRVRASAGTEKKVAERRMKQPDGARVSVWHVKNRLQVGQGPSKRRNVFSKQLCKTRYRQRILHRDYSPNNLAKQLVERLAFRFAVPSPHRAG